MYTLGEGVYIVQRVRGQAHLADLTCLLCSSELLHVHILHMEIIFHQNHCIFIYLLHMEIILIFGRRRVGVSYQPTPRRGFPGVSDEYTY